MHNPFRVSKWAAFWAAVGWIVFAIPLFALHIDMCGQAFLVFAAIYGGIWGYKMYRDQTMVQEAQQRRIDNTSHLVSAPPPRTSKGTTGLFVPAPLDLDLDHEPS